MFAGYYQETNTGSPFIEAVPYIIHEAATSNGFPSTFILTVDPSGGVTKIGVLQNPIITSNIEGYFDDAWGIVTAQNAYVSEEFEITFAYNGSNDNKKKGGLKWWGWFLIVIAILVVLGGAAFLILKCRNS